MAHAVQLLEDGGEDTTPSPFTTSSWTIDARDRKRVAAEVREFSEMIGFWVAWHSTGGFNRLEDNGWSRSTIYRKIKRFREHFGEHPDDYDFTVRCARRRRRTAGAVGDDADQQT